MKCRYPDGIVVRTPPESLRDAGARIASYPVAVKAQVRSGGRGKQGGVQQVKKAEDLAAAVEKLFSAVSGGEKPEAVLIRPWLAIERETYLSVAVDSRADGYVVMLAAGQYRHRGRPRRRRATRSGCPGISASMGCVKRWRASRQITSGARRSSRSRSA
ncbi:MAG: hypothetical protein KIT18_01300 [Burkholderiales bacterium]|nr:hypothetical protein [Burkholderiales bacterium]